MAVFLVVALPRLGEVPGTWYLTAVLALLCLFGILGTMLWRGSSFRAAWLSLTSLCLALTLAEAALEFGRGPARRVGEVQYLPDTGYFRQDPDLGYTLNANRVQHARLADDSGVVYDVTYRTDERGFRRTPASPDTGQVVAFFGGSWTYGEGVEDWETLPNRFAEATHGRYRVLNLSVHGWGPHQVLRAIERERFDSLLGARPAAIVFLAGNWQVMRSAGLANWDPDGPRYVLSPDGIRYAGPFSHSATTMQRLRGTGRALLHLPTTGRHVDSADVAVYVAILARTNRLLLERFATPLTVLLIRGWPEFLEGSGWTQDALRAALVDSGLTVIDGTSPPAPPEDPHRYHFRSDGHPTAAANVVRAESLLEHLRLPSSPQR